MVEWIIAPVSTAFGRTAALALLTSVVACACAVPAPPAFVVDLAGEHRMQVADDPAFAAPDFDDAAWQRVTLPHVWRSRGFAFPPVRWYRLRFELAAPPAADDLALSLGVVGWVDETFVNGRRIGGVGRFDGIPDFPFLPRLYHVPRDALRAGVNVIAIRTRGGPLSGNGFLSDRIGIGPELALARVRDAELVRAVALESILLGLVLFTWVLLAALPKRGPNGRPVLWLWLFVTTQLAHLVFGGTAARELGFDQTGTTRFRFLALCIGLSALWGFCATIARGRLPRVVVVLIAIALALGLVGLVTPEPAFLVVAMAVLGTGADVIIVTLLVLAVRAKAPGARPALIAYVGAVALIWTMLVRPSPYIGGVAAYYIGIAWLAFGGLIALARRLDVLQRRAQRASEYALAAHTEERTRLARDLHDGLGQMLALLKLQFQRTSGKLDDPQVRAAVDDSVAQVDATLEELRRVACDLRPTPLEGRTFDDAVREYAAAMAQRTGIDVAVEGDGGERLPAHVVDELYRIVQEGLTNCLKHSRASRIVVSMRGDAKTFTLAVADNGRGLDASARAGGLGLQTIRERADLLGGTCQWSATEDGGTRLEVRVPHVVVAV